jgi:signal transduction histidine kinase
MGGAGSAQPRDGGGYGTRLLRSLARQAGADIETQSEPGRGTRVTVHFPKG